MLEDIATLTGGKPYRDLGIKLENVKLEDLGRAKKIVIDKDNTRSSKGAGKSADIEGRVKQIRSQVETPPAITKGKAQSACQAGRRRRRHQKVGAAHRNRAEGKKARVEDVYARTRAAVEEGIVPGGGTAAAPLHLRNREAEAA